MHFSLLVVTKDDGMGVEEIMEPYEVVERFKAVLA